MNTLSVLAIIFSAAGTVVSGFALYRGHQVQAKAVEVDEFDKINNAQNRRISDLEKDVGTLKLELSIEKDGHKVTRKLLGIALRHIRAVQGWSTTDRSTPIPEPPTELTDQL